MQQALSSPRHEIHGFYEAIEFYFDKGWTDGLPVVPPTEERVRAFLAACERQPADVIGVVPTRGRAITAEKIAVNAVMAGCRPEYMPVLIAIIEAMTDPGFNYHGALASTGGSAQLIVVGGPIARRLEVNGGVNVFGPGFRANATIGRAVRLVIINVTDGKPGVLDKSTIGHGGKYSMVIAENEDALPWEPLHVARGHRPEDSTVTVFSSLAPLQISDGTSNRPEPYLDNVAQVMRIFGPKLGQFVILMPPEHARIFRNAGWTRRQAQDYLHPRLTVTLGELRRRPGQGVAGAHEGGQAPDEERLPIVETPEGLIFLVAGGEAGGFTHLIHPWGGGRGSIGTTRLVRA